MRPLTGARAPAALSGQGVGDGAMIDLWIAAVAGAVIGAVGLALLSIAFVPAEAPADVAEESPDGIMVVPITPRTPAASPGAGFAEPNPARAAASPPLSAMPGAANEAGRRPAPPGAEPAPAEDPYAG